MRSRLFSRFMLSILFPIFTLLIVASDVSAQCVGQPNGTPCDDGSACTSSDSCQSEVCVGVPSVVCTASDQCHDVGICNPGTGICSQLESMDKT